MEKLIRDIDRTLSVQRILAVFWTLFWLLNGLDKFFNGEHFFGVTRDAKFVAYFASLNLSPDVAVFCLYSCGILEILLGIGFVICLFRPRRDYQNMLLCLKISMLIFVTFSAFDILFGDRTELWEHGTFLMITLGCWLFFKLNWNSPSRTNLESNS